MSSRQACKDDVTAAVAADYGEAAVAAAGRSIEARLAGVAGGAQIAAQVETLLAARNGERALRLLDETPLRSRWLVPGLVVGGLVLGGALIVGFTTWIGHATERARREATSDFIPFAAAGPDRLDQASRQFLGALTGGRLEEAYGLMTAPYRAAVSLARFRAATTSPYLHGVKKLVVTHSWQTGGAARLEAFLSTDAGDVEAMLYLSHEARGWAVTGLNLGGSPALPALAPR